MNLDSQLGETTGNTVAFKTHAATSAQLDRSRHLGSIAPQH
jgi:hypothetical protein